MGRVSRYHDRNQGENEKYEISMARSSVPACTPYEQGTGSGAPWLHNVDDGSVPMSINILNGGRLTGFICTLTGTKQTAAGFGTRAIV